MSFSRLYSVVGGYFRRRRRSWLLSEFADCRTVVDMGGTLKSWDGIRFPSITLVNVIQNDGPLPSGLQFVQADACHSSLSTSFDLAYSNSAIEHLGNWERQREFAKEMLRLGRRVYCQTPNRWFPIEPHFLALFVHWLPQGCFSDFAHRYLTLQGLAQKPSAAKSKQIRVAESIRLLTKRELRDLFPGCHIRVERFLGWPKSFAAWR